MLTYISVNCTLVRIFDSIFATVTNEMD